MAAAADNPTRGGHRWGIELQGRVWRWRRVLLWLKQVLITLVVNFVNEKLAISHTSLSSPYFVAPPPLDVGGAVDDAVERDAVVVEK